MNKDKFSVMASDLKDLISDYESCKNELAKLTLEELIVSYANNFVKIYSREKSEMPCNCKRELYEIRKVG